MAHDWDAGLRVAATTELLEQILVLLPSGELRSTIRIVHPLFRDVVDYSTDPVIKWNTYRWTDEEPPVAVQSTVPRDENGVIIREWYPGTWGCLVEIMKELYQSKYHKKSTIRGEFRTAFSYSRHFVNGIGTLYQVSRPPILTRKAHTVFDLQRFDKLARIHPWTKEQWAYRLDFASAKDIGLTVNEVCKQIMAYLSQTKEEWRPETWQLKGSIQYYLNIAIGYKGDGEPFTTQYLWKPIDPFGEGFMPEPGG